MITPLAYAVIALSGVAMLWGIGTAVANRPPGKAQLLFAAAVELLTVVQSGIGLARIGIGFRPAEPATTVGYFIAVVLLLPVAWLWANAERTRYSGLVLAIAAASVLAMTLRLLTLWVPAG